jgi:hypothetical protein
VIVFLRVAKINKLLRQHVKLLEKIGDFVARISRAEKSNEVVQVFVLPSHDGLR